MRNEECVELKVYGVRDAVFSESLLDAISFVDGVACCPLMVALSNGYRVVISLQMPWQPISHHTSPSDLPLIKCVSAVCHTRLSVTTHHRVSLVCQWWRLSADHLRMTVRDYSMTESVTYHSALVWVLPTQCSRIP
jgi:hypothetical protein